MPETEAEWVRRLLQVDEQMERFRAQRNRDGLAAYRQRQEELEHDLTLVCQRIDELRGRILEGEALLGEMTPAAPERVACEERLLDAMVALEDLEPVEAPLRRSLEEVLQELAEASREESERLEHLDRQLQGCELSRRAFLENISSPILQVYHRAPQGKKVAAVQSGRCGHCRMTLADHSQRLLRLGQAVLCPDCQGVLIHSLAP